MATKTKSYLPSPVSLGLPAKFGDWRPHQEDAIFEILNDDKRFTALCAPTGFGKSLVYMAAALLLGKRCLVLTSTKPQQNQLLDDFAGIGLVDIRGQQNYRCRLVRGPVFTTVADGPCHAGIFCEYLEKGCAYFDQVALTSQANLVVTNYAYWFHQFGTRNSLGEFDMLVCDEAHDAFDWLAGYLSVAITMSDLALVGEEHMPRLETFDQWQEKVRTYMGTVMTEKALLEDKIQQGYRRLQRIPQEMFDRLAAYKEFERKLEAIAMARHDWVFQIERTGKKAEVTIRFDPLWPAEFNYSLFRNIPRIVLTSATLRPKTLEVLGIPSSETRFVEYPSTFPVANRPIIHIPSVRMDQKATQEDRYDWLKQIDKIIEARLDRNGIIHAVSFERAQWLLRNSRFSRYFLLNDGDNTAAIIAKFRKAAPPTILVSPSVTTGLHFPHSQCRYQLLCKIPFAPPTSSVLLARSERDRKYAHHLAAQIVVQMAGRSNASEDDWSEIFIIDDNFMWFYENNRELFPQFFREAVQFAAGPPAPRSL